jgi:energy-converting hydrogenase Eha subunit A
MKRNQWRTVGIAALGIVALGIVAALSGRWPSIATIYPSFVGGVVGCVGAVAAKAYGEHKVNAGPTA